MTYDFAEQLKIGKQGEAKLDAYFRAGGFKIHEPDLQHLGVDRIFRRDGFRYTVEYKTDHLSHKTGNAFIEITSVKGGDGWVYTCCAQILYYYVIGDGLVYILNVMRLKERLGHWISNYPIKESPNKTYKSRGVLVPLVELEKLATGIISDI